MRAAADVLAQQEGIRVMVMGDIGELGASAAIETYNANPNSMRAAADVLAQQEGIRVMVMGDIGELGASAAIE
ncbi:UDP-N-acetylmuramoyl-tripeptide--D-alanyl-D-alanine ligase, partial [Corynebacterium diphtheriae]